MLITLTWFGAQSMLFAPQYRCRHSFTRSRSNKMIRQPRERPHNGAVAPVPMRPSGQPLHHVQPDRMPPHNAGFGCTAAWPRDHFVRSPCLDLAQGLQNVTGLDVGNWHGAKFGKHIPLQNTRDFFRCAGGARGAGALEPLAPDGKQGVLGRLGSCIARSAPRLPGINVGSRISTRLFGALRLAPQKVPLNALGVNARHRFSPNDVGGFTEGEEGKSGLCRTSAEEF